MEHHEESCCTNTPYLELDLVLACGVCRARLHRDLMAAHFDIEPGHDPGNIRLDLAAVCIRCDVEVVLDHSEVWPGGVSVDHYVCGGCRRSWKAAGTPLSKVPTATIEKPHIIDRSDCT